ncbi:MAG: hypothetical protein ACRD1P_11540 [Thermoanaerobaculia bacterium]
MKPHLFPTVLHNADANAIGSVFDGTLWRLAVDAVLGGPVGPAAQGNFDSAAVDEATATALWVRAAVTGRDTSAAVGSQNVPIEAQPLLASGQSALAILEARESGFLSSIRGRRFIATPQTAGATLTAQAAFVATTPTLMLRQAAGATETEVIRSLSLTSFAATPAAIRVVVMLDPDDRFSAGGTTIVPQNPNEGSAAASGITSFLENPTATAADADERIIYNGGFPGGIGASLTLGFRDALILVGVGTLLVYIFDALGAAAPVVAHGTEWEEYV